MDVAVLERTRKAKGLSIRQLSSLANVSPSTTSRIERGEMQPSLETFESLLAALGLTLTYTETADSAAIAAARWLSGDQSVTGLSDPGWVERYESLGDAGDLAALCWRASRYAPFTQRATTELRAASVRAFGSAVRAVSQRLVWTGSSAADMYSREPAGTGQIWLYADDPNALADELSDATGPADGIRVLIAPLDAVTEAGIQPAGDQWLAAPLQVVIDCLSGPGRMTDQAWAVLERLGVSYDER